MPKEYQFRVSKKTADALEKVAKKNNRPKCREAEIAIQQYVLKEMTK